MNFCNKRHILLVNINAAESLSNRLSNLLINTVHAAYSPVVGIQKMENVGVFTG